MSDDIWQHIFSFSKLIDIARWMRMNVIWKNNLSTHLSHRKSIIISNETSQLEHLCRLVAYCQMMDSITLSYLTVPIEYIEGLISSKYLKHFWITCTDILFVNGYHEISIYEKNNVIYKHKCSLYNNYIQSYNSDYNNDYGNMIPLLNYLPRTLQVLSLSVQARDGIIYMIGHHFGNSLMALSIGNTAYMSECSLKSLQYMIKKCVNLTVFRIAGCQTVLNEIIILSKCKSLLISNSNLDLNNFPIFSGLLRELNIMGSNITFDMFCLLPSGLRYLSITIMSSSDWVKIVKSLCDQLLPHLEGLKIQLHNILYYATKEWVGYRASNEKIWGKWVEFESNYTDMKYWCGDNSPLINELQAHRPQLMIRDYRNISQVKDNLFSFEAVCKRAEIIN